MRLAVLTTLLAPARSFAPARRNAWRTIATAQKASTLPKDETGVSLLREANPNADGRGVLVAVMDTGCDLAAAGLQTTSNGQPKYIDFLDCTGGGDVDMTSSKTKSADGTLEDASGATLKLGEWAEGVEEFRVGAAHLWTLLPGSTRDRVLAERKELFEATHSAAATRMQRDLDAADAWVPSAEDEVVWGGRANATAAAKKAKKAELEARLKELDGLLKDDYDDAGPLIDVVAFRDEAGWRAVVDAEGTRDLTNYKPMAPFAAARQLGTFGFGSACTYCLQIGDLDDGGALSIVCDAGSHGTHVAGIVAANFEGDDDDADGVAPGAQILALKIGDGRLGSAETGTGLVRALAACKRRGVDLINLSYGEPFYSSTSGRVAQTFDDAVRKWGMTVFTSAGNDGPALSSLGAPGCLTAPITVGAYVSPAMMSEQYSMLPGDVPAASYTFSSRGPTPDGWLPTLCAPGGAVAPIPRHMLAGRAQYHGTSMSSPNACGVAACVLSALSNKPSPPALRRALESTCQPVPSHDAFAQGFGLVDAPAAVAYLEAHAGKTAHDLAFEVTVPSMGDARGIYLRDAGQVWSPAAGGGGVVGVQVKPRFAHATSRDEAEVEEVLTLDVDVALSCAADWVTTPASLVLQSGVAARPQAFQIKIDAAQLPPGAHFTRVEGRDASDPSRGPLFTLPVTAIVPHNGLDGASTDETYGLSLRGGVAERRFVRAPRGAEFAKVKLTTGALPRGPHAVTFHAVPSARGDLPNTACQTKTYPMLREHAEKTIVVPCQGGATLELCVALGWMSNPVDDVPLDMEVEFHSYGLGEQLGAAGAGDSSVGVRIGAADEYGRLEVGAPLRSETIDAAASLKAVDRALRPTKSLVRAGSVTLDALPPSDAELRADPDSPAALVHEAVLTYDFDLKAASADEAAVEHKVVPQLSSLHAQLYDSPIDGAIWRVKDTNGQVLAHGGLIHDAKPLALRAGKYALEVLLRHTDRAALEDMKDLPARLRFELKEPMTCTVVKDRGTATTGGDALTEGFLRKDARRSIYVRRPDGKLPAWVERGDTLVGSLVLDKGLDDKRVFVPLAYEPPPPATPEKKDDATDEDEKSDEDKDAEALTEAVRDAQLSALKALKGADPPSRFNALADSIRTEHPSHLPFLREVLDDAVARLNKATDADKDAAKATGADKADAASRAVAAADAILGNVNADAVAAYFGTKEPRDGAAAKKRGEEVDEQRGALRHALLYRAMALSSDGGVVLDSDDAVDELDRWAPNASTFTEDDDKDTYVLAHARRDANRGRPGAALAAIRARLKVSNARALHDAKLELLETLELEDWVRLGKEDLLRRYPPATNPL